MDVRCPKCQTEYDFDEARVPDTGATVKCTVCSFVFMVRKANQPTSDDVLPRAATREWKVRQPNGNIYTCRELTTLQRWIVEGKVARGDEISLTGQKWKRLGNIPELASFFSVAEDAQRARALELRQKTDTLLPVMVQPSVSPPVSGRVLEPWTEPAFSSQPVADPSPTMPDLTKTLRDPQFSRPAPTPMVPPRSESATADPADTLPLSMGSLPVVKPTSPPLVLAKPTLPAISDDELDRLSTPQRSSGKWVGLVLAGLGVGAAVGYSFVYLPEQERAAQERVAQDAKVQAEAEALAASEAKSRAQAEEAQRLAAAALDAGPADAASFDAGLADAGAAAPKPLTFDQLVAQADRLRDRERPKQALALYSQASELLPERVEPWAGKGLTYLDLSQPAQAEAAFERALALSPRYGPAIMGMAEALRTGGKKAKALEWYQRYLDVLPEGSEAAVARNNLERLQ